jgi:hypothetical protein
MVHLIRTLVSVLSIVTVASSHNGLAAAQSWSFSDAAIAVGPKGKDAASSHPYFHLNSQINGATGLTARQESMILLN